MKKLVLIIVVMMLPLFSFSQNLNFEDIYKSHLQNNFTNSNKLLNNGYVKKSNILFIGQNGDSIKLYKIDRKIIWVCENTPDAQNTYDKIHMVIKSKFTALMNDRGVEDNGDIVEWAMYSDVSSIFKVSKFYRNGEVLRYEIEIFSQPSCDM